MNSHFFEVKALSIEIKTKNARRTLRTKGSIKFIFAMSFEKAEKKGNTQLEQ